MISFLTLGVAVAVRAIIGTPGNLCFNTFNFL
jgi:hypothetical protein